MTVTEFLNYLEAHSSTQRLAAELAECVARHPANGPARGVTGR